MSETLMEVDDEGCSASTVDKELDDIAQGQNLWKAHVVIAEDDIFDKKVFEEIDTYGAYVKVLIVGQRYETSFGNVKPKAKNLTKFFEKMITKNVQLEELVMLGFSCFSYGGSQDTRLLASMSKFLKNQRNLKCLTFGIENAPATKDALKILKSALVNGKDTIEVLNLQDAFAEADFEDSVGILPGVIASFEKLKVLKMMYAEEEFIETIAQGIMPRMERLKVDKIGSGIATAQEWSNLTRVCPILNTIAFIGSSNWKLLSQDIAHLTAKLPKEMPISDLDIEFDEEEYPVFSKVLEYLGDTFMDKIESLTLTGQADERKAVKIIEFVNKLNKLKRIKLGIRNSHLVEFVSDFKKLKGLD